MINYKYILFTVILAFSTLFGTAQNCEILETKDQSIEIANIPGTTMGQKLESLLFWSQEEKERRFPIMQELFPSIPVAAAAQSSAFEKTENIIPQWENNTTLTSYMNNNNVQGVIVIQDDTIKLEKYAPGINKETLWTSFSVAKSVSSMLVGVALKEGAIESIDDPLKKYITDLNGYDYGEVSVRQLLTMTSGIEWNEDYVDHNSDVAQMYLQPCNGTESHILTYMKPLEFAHQPGSTWNYSTGETDLVGILVQKATGKSLAEYLSEKIWKPLGMEHCAYWLADECSNLNIGGSGLSASLRDFARLGSLMLQQGKLGDDQIISEEWLKDATSVLYKTNEEGDGYGYLWWRSNNGSYAAVGIFGQMIYVDPSKNLVIAQMAAWPKASSEELTAARTEFINAVQRAVE
ncbi:serine hydrolase domain-containing protein [Xanthomarina sp. F2636L]|uniref:serine hydrolase domain-containing protein n=1 Tax=Xanthomarina sp. F2636L TaxID=2996018 RepID=UPI00225E047E|nr:serine hydrolase [Xanthomarina sp. F2636L]MCX7549951.1 serine hydrolase [Xanthomarina sp. F2636L]